jgi:DNA-binding PadR family transcriptional regulator
VRTLSTLGLTVLRLLSERPQHPYEIRQQMREQGLDRIVRVTHGALYHTVETLAKNELIRPVRTTRDGKRPERTVYSITADGRDLAYDRVRELLSGLTPEYPVYCAALAFMSLLAPQDAAERLARRCVLLESELAASRTGYDALVKRGFAEVGLVEMRHVQAHLRADLDLTRALVDDIQCGRLDWEPAGPQDPEAEE